MTALSLRNPIAILMLCIGARRLRGRRHAAHERRHVPRAHAAGARHRHAGARARPRRTSRRRISWRLEKYVSATPGVDHVESLSRNNFSVIYVWLKWGTDLNAAQTLVQQQAGVRDGGGAQVARRPCRRSSCSTTRRTRPSCQVVVSGRRATRARSSTTTRSTTSSRCSRASPASRARRPTAGGMRQINVVVDPRQGAGARRHRDRRRRRRRAARTRCLPSGEFIAPNFDANVYTNAIPRARRDHRRRAGQGRRQQARPHPRRRARRGRRHARHRSRCRSTARTPSTSTCCASPAATRSRSSTRSRRSSRTCSDLPPGHAGRRPYFDQSTFVRTTYHGLKKEIVQALVLIALVILLFLQSVRGTLIVSVAIPLSFAITLIVLYATGQTLNAFTLGGLTLAMGRLVDDAVVVLESIHRHQRMGMSTAEAALEGHERRRAPGARVDADDDGGAPAGAAARGPRARSSSRRSRSPSRVAMIASYFVSMAVTPVACRYFLGHARARPARQGASRRFIDRLADGYSRDAARACCRTGGPSSAPSLVLVVASGLGGVAPAEHVLPRDRRVDGHDLRPLRAGHLARGRGDAADRDGRRRSPRELPEGTVRDGRSRTSGCRRTRAARS